MHGQNIRLRWRIRFMTYHDITSFNKLFKAPQLQLSYLQAMASIGDELCFDASVFFANIDGTGKSDDSGFDADSFLLQAMASAADVSAQNGSSALSSLHSDLRTLDTRLDTQLRELLHRDYDKFIDLSKPLDGLSDLLETGCLQPIKTSSASVSQVLHQFENVTQQAASLIEQRQQQQQRQRTLRQLVYLTVGVEQCQKWQQQLDSKAAADTPSPSSLFTTYAAAFHSAPPRQLDRAQEPIKPVSDNDYAAMFDSALSSPAQAAFDFGEQVEVGGYASSEPWSTWKSVDIPLLTRLSRALPLLFTIVHRHTDHQTAQTVKPTLKQLSDALRASLARLMTQMCSQLCSECIDSQTYPSTLVTACFRALLRCFALTHTATHHHHSVTDANVEVSSNLLTDLVASGLVRPVWRHCMLQTNGKEDSASSLERLFIATDKSELNRRVGVFVECLRRLLQSLMVSLPDSDMLVDILVHGVWSSIDALLAPHVRFLCAAGVPATFAAHYRFAIQLIDAVASMSPDVSIKSRITTSAPVTAFLARFNITLYFQLCAQVATAPFDTACAASPPQCNEMKDGDLFRLTSTRSLLAAIESAAAPAALLPPLSVKFFRHACQLIARYGAWIDKGQRAAWRLEGMEPFDAATLLVSTIADVLVLSQWLSTQSNSLVDCWVGSNAQWNADEARKLMTDALNESRNNLSALLPALRERLATQLVTAASTSIKEQVPKIMTMYRMTGKAMPTEPLAYMTSICYLFDACSIEGRPIIDATSLQYLTRGACGPIASLMHKTASELLRSLEKSEQSMRKLRGAQATDANSDGAKIRRQVDLDVRALCRCVRVFCVQAHSNSTVSTAAADQPDAVLDGADVATELLNDLLSMLTQVAAESAQ